MIMKEICNSCKPADGCQGLVNCVSCSDYTPSKWGKGCYSCKDFNQIRTGCVINFSCKTIHTLKRKPYESCEFHNPMRNGPSKTPETIDSRDLEI